MAGRTRPQARRRRHLRRRPRGRHQSLGLATRGLRAPMRDSGDPASTSSASPSTSPTSTRSPSAPSPPTCGCATRSTPSRKPSFSGMPITAWCLCNPTSRRCTICPTNSVEAGTPYEIVIAAGSKPIGATVRHQQGRALPPRAPSKRSSKTAAGCILASAAPRTAAIVSVGTDITTLKLHEEKLMQSEKRLMATVSDLRQSQQTLEYQTEQLADLAENTPRKKPGPKTPIRPNRNSSPI